MKDIEPKPRSNPRHAPYREESICCSVHAKNRERINTNIPIEADLDGTELVRTGVMSDSSLRSSMLSAEDQVNLDDWPKKV